MTGAGDLLVHRFPQAKSIDSVRWLPPVSAFDRFIAAAVHNPDDSSSALEIHALLRQQQNPNNPQLHHKSSWTSQPRISSLRSSHTAQELLSFAFSTFTGSVHFIYVSLVKGTIESELSVGSDDGLFHRGAISSIDLQTGGRECVSVGEDGRVNLVAVGEARL